MKFLTRFDSCEVSNEEKNNGLDKVVRIGYTSMAERVKTIIRQADENFALKMSDFDDLQLMSDNFDTDEMNDVITSNEFDKFQYLKMVQSIQEATQERQEILAQQEAEKMKAYEDWLKSQSELSENVKEDSPAEDNKAEV